MSIHVASRQLRPATISKRFGSDAVQVLGGHGYIMDHPVEKWMRDARTLGVIDGLEFDHEAELVSADLV